MKEFVIAKNDSGQRVNKFLEKAVPLLSGGMMHKYIRLKRIKVNGKRTDASYKLAEGDLLQLYINDEFFEKLPNEFHIDDVLSVSDKNIDACKQMCSRWKRRGKVKALGYGRYQKL